MLAHALLLASLFAAADETPTTPAAPATETATTTPAPAPAPKPSRPPIRLAAESHGSLLNSGEGSPNLNISFGFGIRGGIEFGQWGIFLHVENDVWGATTYGYKFQPGVMNYGVGADFRYAGGFVRTALTIGLSTLLFNTPLDKAGSTGIFLYAVPVGLRWQLSKLVTFGLDPINFVIAMPSMTRIPLAHIEYRFGISVEWGL